MNCIAADHLYMRANGTIPCNCDAGEGVTLFQPDQGRFDFIKDCYNGEPFVRLRNAFSEGKAPLPQCKNCYFFEPGKKFQHPGEGGKLKHISEIQIESSFLCNIDCSACISIPTRTDPDKSPLGKGPYNLAPHIFNKLIDDLVAGDISVSEYVFSGRGEPLLHPSFTNLLMYARKNFPRSRYIAHTNGNIPFHPGVLALDLLIVSIDGAYQSSYEKYRRGGNINKAFRFIQDYVKYRNDHRSGRIGCLLKKWLFKKYKYEKRPKIQWKYILFEHNDSEQEILEAQRQAKEMGVDKLQFVLSHTWNRSKKYTSIDQIQNDPLFHRTEGERTFHSMVNEDVNNIAQWEKEGKNRQKKEILNKIKKNISNRNTTCPHEPVEWYLEVSKICNINCLICTSIYDDRFNDKNCTGIMSKEIFSKAEPYLYNSIVVHPVGHGEPFMNPHLLYYIKNLKKHGPNLSVITNGTLLKGKADALIDSGLDALVVSMDGGEKDIYEHFRAGADWNSVTRNLKELAIRKSSRGADHPEVIIEIVAMRGNIHTLPRLVELAATEWGARRVAVEALCQIKERGYYEFYMQENLHDMPFEQVEHIFSETSAIANRHGIAIIGPYFDGDLKELWKNARIKPLYNIDHPVPGAVITGDQVFKGWALHPAGIKEVVYRVGNHSSCTADYGMTRADVAEYFPYEFPGKKKCGFTIPVNASLMEEGENTLHLSILDLNGETTPVPPFSFIFQPHDSVRPDKRDIDQLPDRNERRWLRENYNLIYDDPSRKSSFTPFCTLPWTTTYIAFDGTVRPCCYSETSTNLGNIRLQPFDEIWNNSKYKQMRSEIINGIIPENCRVCVSNLRSHGRSMFDKYETLL